MPKPSLTPGASYRCPRCHQLHLVEQLYADRTTVERFYLYVTCHGQRFFVGQIAQVADA